MFDDVYVLRMTGAAEYPRHRHTNYEVIYIERGPYRCELNGQELGLEAGQILVIKPGDWHQDHLRDRQRHLVIQFRLERPESGASVVPLFGHDVTPPSQQICRGDQSQAALLAAELRREVGQGDKYAGAVQDILLEALFWRIVRGLDPEVLSEPSSESSADRAKAWRRSLRSSPSSSRRTPASPTSPWMP